MKKAFLTFLAFSFLLLLCNHLQAQNRFDAALFAGLNVCQIDGDGAGRYNHPGLRAGVGSSFALSDRKDSPWRLVVELAYTQKGSYIQNTDCRIALQYVEIPIMLGFNAMDNRLRLAAGVSPALLVGARVTFSGTDDRNHAANYAPVDWLPLTATARYRFSDHLCLEARYQNSMLSATKVNGSGTYRIFRSNTGSFNRLLTIGLAWQF